MRIQHQNLLRPTLADDRPLGSSRQLNYSIVNQPATVHDLLLQKSNGAFELVIWDEKASGNDRVAVNLGETYGTVNVFDVTVGTSPTQTLSNVGTVALTLNDHAMIVELTKP